MPIIVIIFNVTLACCCLVVARQIWLFRLSLRRSTQALILTEMVVHEVLQDAPVQISRGELTVKQWNQFLAQLGPAVQQGRDLMTWVQRSRSFGTIVLGQVWTVRSNKAKRR